MAVKRCTECGAELKLRPDRCPLCGMDGSTKLAAPASKPRKRGEVDDYQRDLRALREQLKRLRNGAEAV